MAQESNFLRKEPCPECGSKDNLARYDDGHAHCFTNGCKYYEPPTDEQNKKSNKQSKPKEPTTNQRKEFKPLDGEVRALTKRGIREDTCKKYGYKIGRMSGGEWVQYVDVRDPFTRELVAQKIRTEDKKFLVKGKLTGELIGSHLFSGGRKLIITEGEIDMLTVSQVQSNKYPVVSLPNGINSVKKTIMKNLDYLGNFEEIIICFDMDEVGREGAIEAAELLIDHNVKIMSLPLKDPNEMLLAGRTEELVNAIWNAQEHRPDGLLPVEDLVEAALKPLPKGLPWIYNGMNVSSNGRHFGEIHTIGAGTGVGKTDFLCAQADFDIRHLHQKVGLFFMENDPTEILQYLGGKADKRLYYEAGHPDQLDLEAQRKAYKKYSGRCFIYDNFGLCDWQKVKVKILYLIGKGYRIFYIDHLTALATGGEKDEKKELEDIMADIATFAKRHNVLFHLVSHLSTPEGKSHEEGQRVSIKHFKGSRAIGFWSHAMYGFERDQQADDINIRSITTIRQLKRRKFGKGVGKVTRIKYDPTNGIASEVGETYQNSQSEDF
ncbi:TPA: toprim domain-containing protein [Vibrio alginolyticus]|uniref:toprim domain-containing protein n=1 Tax=Vibrio TaxID=662 RepID=UPI000BE36CA3|nr:MULTISPECIES: toprim domain-containing protein [Vibrio]ATI48127.1 DNA primase [Vibrio parahaemolyticus]EIF8961666.1 toprim domain-containing protein [Vibrio parahaemolyticus]ELA7329722.1 toprim domain-containing protein [Vibrio parahaemolyticus]MCG9621309.1 toprim domain-containing protein [Vibrio diabolicus]MDW3169168.1 toprim domain-containing protein [Vibrio sp. Y184]